MSGFEPRWLDLREPADHAARARDLLRRAAGHVEAGEGPKPLVVDLGCGTGSTLRALGQTGNGWRWRLVDNDEALLAEASQRRPAGTSVETVTADLARLDRELLSGARLVTASALFDLCSEGFVADLIEALGTLGAGLYAALNYDGTTTWSEPHPMDEAIVAAFNRHQRGDKGFGPALGPQSGAAIARLARQAGFTVETAETPWNLGPDQAGLQERFLEGLAHAAKDTGRVSDEEARDWLASRTKRIATSRCIVGHLDCLVLPKG